MFVGKTNKANGTHFEIILPEKISDPSGHIRQIYFPTKIADIHALHQPLLGNVLLQAGMEGQKTETLAVGSHYPRESTPLTATVKTGWGSIDIFMSTHPQAANTSKKAVLSAGLFQFNQSSPSVIPFTVLLDAKPAVSADSPHYPFTKQREGWSVAASADAAVLNGIIDRLVFQKEKGMWGSVFSGLKLIEKHKVEGKDEYYFSSPSVSSCPTAQTHQTIPFRFAIEIGRSVWLNPQQTNHEPVVIETDKPVFLSQYETDPIAEISRRTGKTKREVVNCLGEFAGIVHGFLGKVLDVPQLRHMKTKKPLLGIHFHKTNRGMNLMVPQDAIFIHPMRDLGETPAAWAHGWVHTAMHESVHWIQRRHGDAFAYSMGDLYSVIEDVHPGLYVRTLNNLTALAKNNEGIFKSLREINNDPLIQNKNYGYINPDTRQRVNGMKNGRDLG